MRVALGAAELSLFRFEPSWCARDRPAGAPVLTGATLCVERPLAEELFVSLASALGEGKGTFGHAPLAQAVRAPSFSPVPLLEATVNHDALRIEETAGALHIEPRALSALAQLAATSLLQAARRALAPDPFEGTAGGCPFCGAHPTLAEERGLERARRL